VKNDLRAQGRISDTIGRSQERRVTEEVIARQPPETQAIIRVLLAKIAELEARLNKWFFRGFRGSSIGVWETVGASETISRHPCRGFRGILPRRFGALVLIPERK